MSKKHFLLILVLVIAFLFRFYNFQKLQYWSGDEEIASAVVRRMIFERRPTLVSPNLAVNSLGSFFHILSVPIFLAANLDPIKIELFMSAIGILTTFIVFKAGLLLKDTKVAFASALVYASSFVIALFDRRWWPLSLNPLLTSIAIISLFQIVARKRYIYSVPLAVSIGFAAHADPTLGVIAPAAILSFIFFKISPKRKEHLLALLILILFITPLVLFEARHPGSISQPLLKTVNRVFENTTQTFATSSLPNPIITLSRLIFPKPSNFAEKHFCYCPIEGLTFFPLAASLVVLVLMAFPIYKIFIQKGNFRERNQLIILYLFLFSFALGGTIYTISYKNRIFDHYFTVIFPAIALIFGYSLSQLLKRQIFLIAIGIYFLINLYTLVNSNFKYPLSDKKQLTKDVIEKLEDHDFSLYSVGGGYMHGGGFTSLFILQNKHPKKSYIYPFYDWMYRAYSLYTVDPQVDDQEKIVLIGSLNNFPSSFENLDYQQVRANLKAVIIDNSKGDFDQKTLPVFGID